MKYQVPIIIHLPNNPYEPYLSDQLTQTPSQNSAASPSPHCQQLYCMQEAVWPLLRPTACFILIFAGALTYAFINSM